jgi:hypothetical protein
MGLERGPLSVVRIIEELLEWKSKRLRSRNPKLTTTGDSLRWPRDTLCTLKLSLTSPTSGGSSAMEFDLFVWVNEQRSHKSVELRGEYVEWIHFVSPVACCFLHKAKNLTAPPPRILVRCYVAILWTFEVTCVICKPDIIAQIWFDIPG